MINIKKRLMNSKSMKTLFFEKQYFKEIALFKQKGGYKYAEL